MEITRSKKKRKTLTNNTHFQNNSLDISQRNIFAWMIHFIFELLPFNDKVKKREIIKATFGCKAEKKRKRRSQHLAI